MEEQYTVVIYEHKDRHGRFLAFQIDTTGRRSIWVPAKPAHTHSIECISHATRVANPVPGAWLERLTA